MRQLVLRNAGAKVPDADDDGAILQLHGRSNLLPLAAVLGSVIKNVQKHLPQPRRVAGDLGNLVRRLNIAQLDALLAEPARRT